MFGFKTYIIVAILIVVIAPFWDSTPEISTVVAPHHDLVAEQRNDMFKALARRQKIDTFILLSPDHYNLESGDMLVYEKPFETRFGLVEIDTELTNTFKESGAQIGGSTFKSEHGIRTILPDIAQYFPNAKIAPVVIKADINSDYIEKTLQDIRNSCAGCVLIASVDMSHYQPYAISDLHDQLTLRAMYSLDRELVETKAEVGPPHVLSAGMYWAQASMSESFNLAFHTNSTQLTGDPFEEGTTHIAGWYQAGAERNIPPTATFSFVGDIMFDRGVRERADRIGQDQLLSLLGDRVLWGTDVVMANLEGPLTSRPVLPTAKTNAPRFSFEPSNVSQLDFLGINALNTSNNHVADAGVLGIQDTKKVLNANDIAQTNLKPMIFEGKDLSIVVLSVDVVAGEKIPKSTLEKYASEDYRVVIYAHWGLEGEPEAGRLQGQLAREWVDAGADLIVGSGPHVIQGAEVYKKRPIFYSLGNFIFDMQEVEGSSEGLMIAGEFTADATKIVASLIDTSNIQPVLERNDEATVVLRQYLRGIDDYVTETSGGLVFTIPR